jgi:hypothetical protein
MFQLLGVTLLQPEAVTAARLPGGAGALGSFVQGVKSALSELYDGEQESGARTLTIALGVEGRLGFWLSAGEDALPAAEETRLAELTAPLQAPEVVDGPVALALVFHVGPDAPADVQLTLPDAWQAVVKAADTPLTPEQIITRLWLSN